MCVCVLTCGTLERLENPICEIFEMPRTFEILTFSPRFWKTEYF